MGVKLGVLTFTVPLILGAGSVAAQAAFEVGESGRFYVAAEANIRDRATSEGANLLGKAVRGRELLGSVVVGDDGTSSWLELEDGQGYVGVINLSRFTRPNLTSNGNGAAQAIASPCAFQASPQDGAPTKVTLEAGQSVRVIGTVAGGRTEYALPRGGVGYRRSITGCQTSQGAGTQSLGAPINITWVDRGENCDFGSDIMPYFTAASRDADARQRRNPRIEEAMLSGYAMVGRPWGDLTVTAVSVNYESIHIYCREPIANVLRSLRARGFRLNDDNPDWAGVEVLGGHYVLGNGVRPSEGADLRHGRTIWSCG